MPPAAVDGKDEAKADEDAAGAGGAGGEEEITAPLNRDDIT